MKLHVVQAVRLDLASDILYGRIDEHPHTLGTLRHEAGPLHHVPRRTVVEDEAHPIHAKCLHGLNIVALGHATHFNDCLHIIHLFLHS